MRWDDDEFTPKFQSGYFHLNNVDLYLIAATLIIKSVLWSSQYPCMPNIQYTSYVTKKRTAPFLSLVPLRVSASSYSTVYQEVFPCHCHYWLNHWESGYQKPWKWNLWLFWGVPVQHFITLVLFYHNLSCHTPQWW